MVDGCWLLVDGCWLMVDGWTRATAIKILTSGHSVLKAKQFEIYDILPERQRTGEAIWNLEFWILDPSDSERAKPVGLNICDIKQMPQIAVAGVAGFCKAQRCKMKIKTSD